MTLIELLIVAGILGVTALASATLISHIMDNLGQVLRKADSAGLKSQLIGIFQDPGTCSALVNPALPSNATNPNRNDLYFDTTSAQPQINVHFVWTGNFYGEKPIVREADSRKYGLRVASVRIKNLRPADGALTWVGTWDVSFSNASVRPIELPGIFELDPVSFATTPTNTYIGACKIGTDNIGPISKCPAGWTLIGPPFGIGSFCIQNSPNAARPLLSAVTACAAMPTGSFGLAHLCRHREWVAACRQPGVMTAPFVFEMFNNFDEEGYMTSRPDAAQNCNTLSWGYNVDPSPYRCCI